MADIHVEVMPNQEPEEVLQLKKDSLDPKLHYRWCRNDSNRLARMAAKGYRLVSRKRDKVKTVVDDMMGKDGSVDDHITVGDVILVCKPKEEHAKRVERQRQLTESRLQAADEQFKRKAAEASGGLEKPIEVVGVDEQDRKELKE